MGSQMLNPMNKKENLRLLRRRLGLTQKDFIGRFLSDEEGVPSMSVATLSNLESRGGPRLNDVILMAADALQIDSMLFSMKPEEFIQRIDILLPGGQDVDDIRSNAVKKGKIDQLLYRLTMYFAERLIDKELKKGDKIESDRVLAKKMNVGRSAIREALKVLDVLGMIDIHPGQGTFISNDEASFFIIPLSWSLFKRRAGGGNPDSPESFGSQGSGTVRRMPGCRRPGAAWRHFPADEAVIREKESERIPGI